MVGYEEHMMNKQSAAKLTIVIIIVCAVSRCRETSQPEVHQISVVSNIDLVLHCGDLGLKGQKISRGWPDLTHLRLPRSPNLSGPYRPGVEIRS